MVRGKQDIALLGGMFDDHADYLEAGRSEFSPLGPLAGCFLALGSGLRLVGTVTSRR